MIGEARIYRGRLLDRERARDEEFDRERFALDKVDEAGEVAALCPTDVARGVVDAVELVPFVVTARSVRAREADVELLLVVRVPREVEAGLADVDNPGAVAGDARRDVHRVVRRAAGRDEHVVGAEAAGCRRDHRFNLRDPFGVGRRARKRACCFRRPATSSDNIESDDPDTCSNEQLHHELADEAEPDHARQLAELHLGAAYAVHCNGANGREGGVLGRHSDGHWHAEVHGHPVHFRVQGVVVTCARDELTDRVLLGARSDLFDDAAQGVTERRIGVELARGTFVGLGRAQLHGRVNDLAQVVGPGACLAQQ